MRHAALAKLRTLGAPAELRTLGALAAPIVITQLSQMAMGVADAVMAGNVSATDLAGVTLGGSLYWPILLFMQGLVMAVAPTVSQLHGAGRTGEAGAHVRQALWVAVSGGVLVTIALHHAEPLYRLVGVDERGIPVAVGYLEAASLGLTPLLAYVALRYLCEGMAWPRAAMWISATAFPLKVGLNWIFIHGWPAIGLPALGGVGCGWATAITMTYSLVVMVFVVSLSRIRASNVFAAFSAPSARRIRSLLALGLPIGFTLFLELAFFSFVSLLVGRIGVETVAAHQVAFNVVSVAFMVPLAIGMAATVRVGVNVGAGNVAAARTSAWVAVATTCVWGVAIATALMVLRHEIVTSYTDEPEVIRLAAALLALGALFQVFDATQVTIMGALRGYKDTRAPMVVAAFAYWLVGLPIGYIACFGDADAVAALNAAVNAVPKWAGGTGGELAISRVEGMGVRGLWWGLVAGLAVAALALVARLARVSGDPARIAQLRLR